MLNFTAFEITAGHHCGGETFQSIFSRIGWKCSEKVSPLQWWPAVISNPDLYVFTYFYMYSHMLISDIISTSFSGLLLSRRSSREKKPWERGWYNILYIFLILAWFQVVRGFLMAAVAFEYLAVIFMLFKITFTRNGESRKFWIAGYMCLAF